MAGAVPAQNAPAAAPAPASPQPPPAALHPIPEGGLTIEDVVAWLQSAGYAATVKTSESGKRHIVSNAQGWPVNIYLGDPKGDRFSSLEFSCGFATHGRFDIAKINEWNTNNRWCRAYYDSVNDPWIEIDIDLWPGGTYESLNDQLAIFNKMLGTFVAKYGLA